MSLKPSFFSCRKAMSLLHVTFQMLWQCTWPRIASLHPAKEGTFVGGHMLMHGFHKFENLGACRASGLFYSWRRTIFGLEVCHKHLFGGIAFPALLAPMPLLFATAFLVHTWPQRPTPYHTGLRTTQFLECGSSCDGTVTWYF